jgi:site-specific recombinase XerD
VSIDDREPEHLLFFTKYGTPITPYKARWTFRQILERSGLADRGIKTYSFHEIVATLISQDADAETAAEMLGHSGTQITKTHYIERSSAPNPATATILDKLAPPVTDP